MDLFKKLDEFCNACELIQDKAVGERSCFVDDIHQTIRNTDELVITCDRIQADYKYLQSEVNKLKSEFFSDEVTDIKQKFETVEHLYLKVVRHLKDQLDYLNLYRSIYETCVNVRSTLNGPAYKDLHKLTDFERKGIRGNMEDLYLRVLGEQFSLAELHQLNTTVEVKVYGDTQHYHLHNLDNFVRETLLNIRNLWDAISDGTVTLESVVEKRKKMAEKEKSLKAKLVALKLRYDQSRIPLSETNLNTALNDLIERLEVILLLTCIKFLTCLTSYSFHTEQSSITYFFSKVPLNLQEISSELVSNISNYESFLVEMGLSRNDWPNKELQKNCTALEQNLQRRISTLSSNLQR